MNYICISGGISSAWVAKWAKNNLPQAETVYYFNDTRWEHCDLYRFLSDVEKTYQIKITHDDDGRNPEEVFRDEKMLGNNRAPLCSKILKAERLQAIVKPGDVLFFGIDRGELKRAARISAIYDRLQCESRFPIIEEMKTRADMQLELEKDGLVMPELYRMGFEHNNCAGGCVRAGLRQWKKLLTISPDVYRERERVETEFNAERETNYSYMKNLTLKRLREIIEMDQELPFDDDDMWHGECVGICGKMS
jgi:3'-phosphoadenosine 5'-phosphosulfate sulfotransferase (PAPS reductase)/FAD synthetase